MSYQGKSAIITGGATGIGRAMALSLAQQGAKVAVADIDMENAQSAVDEIKAAGGDAVAYKCDVADSADIASVFASAFQNFGSIDYAFINAGVTQLSRLQDLSAMDLEWMFKVNVFGAWECAKCFVKETKKAGAGKAHIVFTGSENSLSIPPESRVLGVGGYNMTKHAMLSMAETFRYELEGENIGVSLAIPGGVFTGILFSVQKRQDAFGGAGTPALSEEDLLQAAGGDLPMLSPEEAADFILKGATSGHFYIPTHPHVLDDFKARAAEIEAAFSAASF